jgi:hypothetical protein
LAEDQPRAAEHPSSSGEYPSRHEIEFIEDSSGHEMEFAGNPPAVPRRRQTKKVPTNPESQPIIKLVGDM